MAGTRPSGLVPAEARREAFLIGAILGVAIGVVFAAWFIR